MASVFRARRDGASEDCVLKLLHLELEGDVVAQKRFLREAHLTSALHHPNVARLLDAGSAEGSFYIAFEFIEGLTAKKINGALHAKGVVTPVVGLTIISKVLKGLAYAHQSKDAEGRSMSLVHRDLSPSNIMVSFDGEVKIIDFGLAAASVDTFKTQAGRIVGTVRYMSPEQVRGAPLDLRSDLYTVGVVLYEMLMGRRLVPRGSRKEMMRSVVECRVPNLSERSPRISPALNEVVHKALAKKPQQRFQSAEAFHSALLEAVEGTELMSRRDLARFIRKHFPQAPVPSVSGASIEATQTVPVERALVEDPARVKRLVLESFVAALLAFGVGWVLSQILRALV